MTDKIEEVKKIINPHCYGVGLGGYPCPIPNWGACEKCKELAQQICQLFEPKFNNALEADAHNWDTRELPKPEFLPTEDEIKEWIARTMGHLNPEYKPYLLMGVEALYVHLGGNKFLEENYDKPKS